MQAEPSHAALSFLAAADERLRGANIGFEVRAGDDARERDAQNAICARFGATPDYPKLWQKAGLARDSNRIVLPTNGVRHNAVKSTCGWYFWDGEELPTDRDAFRTIHVVHLRTVAPDVLPYLALPPGWRFQIARDYEDVWFDEAARID
jgi:hypothetical protein